MELELFDFIEKTISEFDMNRGSYSYVEGVLKNLYGRMMQEKKETVVSINTRVKASDSLKEKLIRNKFYLHCKNAEDAIEHLTDLVGITIQCRFIRNETELYQYLFQFFKPCTSGYNECLLDPNLFLYLHMSQPQLQRNGFTIFRIDGYYLFNGKKINYELQIKSMVHSFWSEIEHEVVYKNPDFVSYDRFLKELLATVRDNLDVVDRQLETIYDQIADESRAKQIGMDSKGFKVLAASSINELMNQKMIESVGFTTDFKKCSSILAQYVYIIDFLNGDNNQARMVDYLEHLNLLSVSEMDFKNTIRLEHDFKSDDPFCQIIGSYWQSVMNVDFEWHAFFVMLFAIQPSSSSEDFSEFISVIKKLLIQPSWFESTFSRYSKKDQKETQSYFERALAEALIQYGKIEMIHEDRLVKIMDIFRRTIESVQTEYTSYALLRKRIDDLGETMTHEILRVFH